MFPPASSLAGLSLGRSWSLCFLANTEALAAAAAQPRGASSCKNRAFISRGVCATSSQQWRGGAEVEEYVQG